MSLLHGSQAWCIYVLSVWLVVAQQSSDAQCISEECRPVAAAALLQTGTAALSKHSVAAENDRVGSEAEKQLAEYTRLKQAIAQNSESAGIMKKIDEALDGGLDSGSQKVNKSSETLARKSAQTQESSVETARNVDDVFKAQASAVQNLDDVFREQAAPLVKAAISSPKHRAPAGLSLVEVGAAPVHRSKQSHKKPARDLTETSEDEGSEEVEMASSEGEDSDTDAAEGEGQSKDEESDESEESNGGSADGSTDDAEEETEVGSTADAEEETEAGSADDAEEEAEDSGNDETEGVEYLETPQDELKQAKKSSLMAMRTLLEADTQPLDEDGFAEIADLRSNNQMERFVKRLASDMDLSIVDPGGLKGMVPFFSGQKATQSFVALQEELLDTAQRDDGWLSVSDAPERLSTSLMHYKKKKKARRESVLLQTEQSQKQAKPTPVHSSLLGTAASIVHKVPDLAAVFLGSRTIILLCMVGLVLCLFSLDERKRTGGKGKEYEDPLNMSPEPPQ